MSPFQWCLHRCSVHHAFVTISSAIYVGNEKMMLLHCWWRLFWHCIVHYRYYWRWRTVSMGLLTERWQLLLLAMNPRRMMSSLIGLWWLPIVWEFSMICISFSCFSVFAFKRVPRPSRDLISPSELKYAVNRKQIDQMLSGFIMQTIDLFHAKNYQFCIKNRLYKLWKNTFILRLSIHRQS